MATLVPAMAGCGATMAAARQVSQVVVHPHRTINSGIFGLGVQWEQYVYPPAAQQWSVILQRVSFMRPGFLRIMGANNGNWRLQPEVPLILGWAQKHHSQVILGTWWAPPLYHRYSLQPMAPDALRRWADDTVRSIARFRLKDGFTCIHFYNFVNEPQNVPIARWASVAKALEAALARIGMAQAVKIIGPDTYGDPGNDPSYHFPLLRQVAQDAGHTVGLYDIHWYPEDKEILNGLIESTLVREKHFVISLDRTAADKPFIVSESGLIQGRCNGDQQPRVKTFNYGVLMADYAAQVFRAGWNSISAWDLDDAMCVVNGQPILHPPGKLTLKIWGFWNSQGPAMGDPADFKIRPWFYTWSLMSRLFPSGSRIVVTDEPAGRAEPHGFGQFRTLAGTHIVNGKPVISVVLVNDSTIVRNVVVRIVADTRTSTFTEYRYFRNDRPVDAQGFPVAAKILHDVIPANGLTVTMPGRGVVFLTSRAPFRTP
ncbi:MAG: hypothetical protein ACP5I8_09475 [Phycisphaerae bacterium]